MKDGIKYFKHQLETNLKTPLQIFKCCRLFSPQKISEMNPTSLSVKESLTCVSFFDNHEQQHILTELPTNLTHTTIICGSQKECFHSLNCHLESSRKWPCRTMSRLPLCCNNIINFFSVVISHSYIMSSEEFLEGSGQSI